MSGGHLRGRLLFELPPKVYWAFCRVMDGLSDQDWTRFASEVLLEQTDMRLAERRDRRTDLVMNQWANRNGRVGDLIDLLESLQLFLPCDVILTWASGQTPPPPPPPPVCSREEAPPPPSTCQPRHTEGERPLPGPALPPPHLQSVVTPPTLTPPPSSPPCGGVMCWSYGELRAQTRGFSCSLQVGEGGFGVVYRARLNKTDCAIKRLRQDSLLDWTLLKESFQTEVEKLSKFRHPNIVDLLGFSEGEGSMCVIYPYMENRSLDDQLHNSCSVLSWSQRVSVVEGASAALQFLHCPPKGQQPLIHGDIKSSNILLDRHMEAKLADFGLARFVSGGPSGPGAMTASVIRTGTVRGTAAYLPEEYLRNGELGTAVDVFGFGVVLLEVLTGRQAEDRASKDRYLKDLVEDVKDEPSWRRQLDQRLVPGGAAEPVGFLQVVDLACKCLDKRRKKRPEMTEVFESLQDVHRCVRKTSCSSSSSSSSSQQVQTRPPSSLDSSVRALSDQFSRLGPSEDTYQPLPSSSSWCSLTRPHPLHCSSSLPPLSSSSSSLPPLSSLPPVSSSLPPLSSFLGPCETDESRGFSQFDLRSLSPSGPGRAPSPSLPTEDQNQDQNQDQDHYCQLSQWGGGATGGRSGFSPAGSLQTHQPPVSQLLDVKRWIQTKDRLSSEDLYRAQPSGPRGPEESDELDFFPAKRA